MPRLKWKASSTESREYFTVQGLADALDRLAERFPEVPVRADIVTCDGFELPRQTGWVVRIDRRSPPANVCLLSDAPKRRRDRRKAICAAELSLELSMAALEIPDSEVRSPYGCSTDS